MADRRRDYLRRLGATCLHLTITWQPPHYVATGKQYALTDIDDTISEKGEESPLVQLGRRESRVFNKAVFDRFARRWLDRFSAGELDDTITEGEQDNE